MERSDEQCFGMDSRSQGFFNFILFYFLRYKFRNSLKLCPYGLDILKTMAGFSLKDMMEFVDKIKDRRTVSPQELLRSSLIKDLDLASRILQVKRKK